MHDSSSEENDMAHNRDTYKAHVKLVHTDELRKWCRFVPYSMNCSITLAEYESGKAELVSSKDRLSKELERYGASDEVVRGPFENYDRICIDMPLTWLRRTTCVQIPPAPFNNTSMQTDVGLIKGDTLTAPTLWKKRRATILRACHIRELGKTSIDLLRLRLPQVPHGTIKALSDARSSRFNDPVIFVSHQWE